MYYTAENVEAFRKAARSIGSFGAADKELGVILDQYDELLEKIKVSLKNKIEALPDNPRIHRIGSNAFTVKSSDLVSAPWSPFYHDFKSQYAQIIEWIDTKRVDDTLALIGEIIVKGKIYRTGGKSLMFHPDVVEHLKNLE